ncbi:MAG: 5,10-methylenetetrahydrofolate reductase [Chloroflexi bacterium]|nr:5,10-methylenetetrahydrofolate reductase [Chloroflexota bacterium]
MHLSEFFRNGRFVITCEITPPKGVNTDEFLNTVDMVKNHVDAVNIGDNQRAVMRAAALAVCHLLKQKNIEPVMELTARDRNRIAIQSDLLGASMVGIENILLVSGYPPAVGDHAQAKPVYDFDSVSLVSAAKSLTKGQDVTGHALDGAPDFCIGVVANPGLKPAEPHLERLKQKIAEGAQFIQTQTVYDLEVLERFMEAVSKFNVPVMVGHTMLRSASMASFMNSNLPGVCVPDKLIRELEGLPKQKIAETSLQLSIDLLRRMKPLCQGIHFMVAGWEQHMPTVAEAVAGKRPLRP